MIFCCRLQSSAAQEFQICAKNLYDVNKANLPGDTEQSLPELITANFDDEQIWQELELHNAPSVHSLMASVARLTVGKPCTFGLALEGSNDEGLGEDLEDPNEEHSDQADDDEDNGNLDDDEDADDIEDNIEDEDDELLLKSLGDNDDGEESEEEQQLKALLDKVTEKQSDNDSDSDINFDFDTEQDSKAITKNIKDADTKSGSKSDKIMPDKKRKTVVDDQFFKLAEMEAFLEAGDMWEEKRRRREEAGEESEEEDEEDLGENDSEDEVRMSPISDISLTQ